MKLDELTNEDLAKLAKNLKEEEARRSTKKKITLSKEEKSILKKIHSLTGHDYLSVTFLKDTSYNELLDTAEHDLEVSIEDDSGQIEQMKYELQDLQERAEDVKQNIAEHTEYVAKYKSALKKEFVQLQKSFAKKKAQ
jgi:hypothetical protein